MTRRPQLRTRLGMGELEARVMNVLWDDTGWLTSAEVNGLLDSNRVLASSTVMTILVRLVEKGLVIRERRGGVWAYRSQLSREEHAAQRMKELLRAGGEQSISLARFIESMTAKERVQLRKLLDARGRKR